MTPNKLTHQLAVAASSFSGLKIQSTYCVCFVLSESNSLLLGCARHVILKKSFHFRSTIMIKSYLLLRIISFTSLQRAQKSLLHTHTHTPQLRSLILILPSAIYTLSHFSAQTYNVSGIHANVSTAKLFKYVCIKPVLTLHLFTF